MGLGLHFYIQICNLFPKDVLSRPSGIYVGRNFKEYFKVVSVQGNRRFFWWTIKEGSIIGPFSRL